MELMVAVLVLAVMVVRFTRGKRVLAEKPAPRPKAAQEPRPSWKPALAFAGGGTRAPVKKRYYVSLR